MKFKNPLDYVDKFNDLIKFAFKNNHNFLGIVLLVFAFIIPVLFFIGYSAVPLEKYIKNPYVISGVIKEYKYGKGGYRNYAGCLISIENNGKNFTHKYKDDLLSEMGISNSDYTSFCDKVKDDYLNKKCVSIKMADKVLMEYKNCNQPVFYAKQNWDWHYKIQYISYLIGLIFLIIEICLLINLNTKYKK
ncbi:hypothetical protein OFO01_04935 [Campylobacter sp. JMF_01 NE2]|uniref:hypothetical protein n=1 Tax=unclassified Campylobacter TaxID=2593542 RepID=UPI0022E9C020|nr:MULTISPECIES: hypothetical protein [unclassified Campylobacter]MDA3052797.1 hypothetical protein [Campylobacter sp. JMF_03 NE3]MDA3067128.1 hypothetical protein [Campylobacter sp. JMF_01 NE2]